MVLLRVVEAGIDGLFTSFSSFSFFFPNSWSGEEGQEQSLMSCKKLEVPENWRMFASAKSETRRYLLGLRQSLDLWGQRT
ncbi:hypothetical protein CEXT_409491 [Caerostris extrusa]|uniref:Uncharacterized protein n=1 Tax=Caerostris extrusa TaxID=172846 RepID=A0AAV4S5Y7_CAEEX|nr:hypothetical protein CEXT_409491 [Caerostris extrusa]